AAAPDPDFDPASRSLRSLRLSKNLSWPSTLDWTHFGFAIFKASLNRLLTRAAQKVVTGTPARRPVLRDDLNLKEVGKSRASPAGNLLPFETLAEVDFNSCRLADTV